MDKFTVAKTTDNHDDDGDDDTEHLSVPRYNLVFGSRAFCISA